MGNLNSVLKQALPIVIPSKEEQYSVNEAAGEIVQIISEKGAKIGAELVVGGSVAKGSWLPNIHDIDCFLRFDYIKYKNKSDQLPDLAEKIIQSCFKEYKRLHGSRDYFQVKYQGFDIEIIPVLKINKPEMMRNITDVSPLHFIWLAKRSRQLDLSTDIRLAKQFFKANGLYGAESFIRGISGHVIEVMTIHYGGFAKLLRAISKWSNRAIVDPEQRYVNEKQLMLLMNESKLVSPLIVVDPIQPERNAAAALSKEKFMLLKKISKSFLANPSLSAFKEKKLTAKQIRSRKTKSTLLLFSVDPDPEVTIDVAGCKILSTFEDVTRLIAGFDFKIVKQNWCWDKENSALLWFYLDPKTLPAQFRHAGPPVKLADHARAFKKEWKNYSVKVSKGKLYVDLPRKVRTSAELLNEIKREFKSIKVL
jgi:tRNA nucleotidyltransferase (CCA-adding enzyme)